MHYIAHQAPLSMRFPLQEYWSGLSFPSPRGSSWLRDWTQVSCIGRWILYHWATRETLTMISKFKFSHSVMSDSLWTHESQHARPPCPSPTPEVYPNPNSRSLPKPISIVLVMPSSHLTLCCPLLLPPILPSVRIFYNESTLRMRGPKSWSFSFSIIPSKEHPGLISFRMDWLDLLAVQGTLKSLL